MGVEYAHGLFVADLAWRPTWAHVGKIHDVLVQWNLARREPTYLELGGFDLTKLDVAAAAQMPANLRVDYGGLAGAPVVAVMGGSQFDLDASQRYLQEVYVVLGVNFKILKCETYEVRIEAPAVDDGEEVEVDECVSGIGGSLSYPASWSTTPPRTEAPGPFTGIWRSALILDCGKDLPEIAEDCCRPLPARGSSSRAGSTEPRWPTPNSHLGQIQRLGSAAA